MRAAPACQVSLRRFEVWRGAVLLLAVSGVAVVIAWLITRQSPLTSPSSIAVAVSTLLLVGVGSAFGKTRPVDLRWDGREWHLGPATGETVSGDVSVAIDLGPWMMLRFVPTWPERRMRVTWLPVQRRGLAPQWHALRCAVYSPRSAPTEDAPVAF